MNKFSRRLIRLESRTAAITAEAIREPQILQFVDTDMTVVSSFNMGTCVWTHFRDEPRTAPGGRPRK